MDNDFRVISREINQRTKVNNKRCYHRLLSVFPAQDCRDGQRLLNFTKLSPSK
ncbi:hypothetical protein K443DRAFT_674164 [Laccaria amethystina LaAM-08-1]|uniref:Uncharacterized protein n=1 Tax=Laccaria amethystina LaAM-08-1 TaxID=1095629 RepID=A0A0C9X326_9AGAR|nr:hypothetical protein K443DRAFT_674164 [Laccaria amethystina LaAM-08-1]